MKNVLLASVAVAVFGLAGCASEDKMMKDEAMADEAVVTEEVMVKEEAMAADSGQDPMMDLCFEKGGSIGAWGGEGDDTKTCDTPDGNSYPLAQLTSFEAFQ